MTSGAGNAAHPDVARMIEIHPKASQSWKRLHRTGFCVRVTDCTNWAVAARELLCVTSGTRQMTRGTRPFRYSRIRFTPVTKQTRQPGVIAAVVLKLRIVESLGKLHLHLWL
jgi:hypothetical protein